jgi:hypothetical protein
MGVFGMVKSPWTREEFKTIIQNHNLRPRDFCQLLPNRSPAAIANIHSGIHSFHLGGCQFMLTDMMLKVLLEARGSLVCPVCGVQF